jgi:predicted  nucleic acid-binding Zn-ribbon protein
MTPEEVFKAAQEIAKLEQELQEAQKKIHVMENLLQDSCTRLTMLEDWVDSEPIDACVELSKARNHKDEIARIMEWGE